MHSLALAFTTRLLHTLTLYPAQSSPTDCPDDDATFAPRFSQRVLAISTTGVEIVISSLLLYHLH